MHAPNAAFELARNLSKAQMARDTSVGATTKTLIKLRQIADTDWEEVGASAKANNIQIACREGCDFCCNEPVTISFLEAVSLAEHVASSFSDQERQRLAERAREYRRRSREGLACNPCPFLQNSRCTIYAQRPLMCRGVHSINVDVCKERLTGTQAVRPCAQNYAAECEAMMDGLSLGVPDKTVAEAFELGIWAERIAAGSKASDYVIEALAYKPLPKVRAGEPSGISVGIPPTVGPYIQLRDGDHDAALASIADLDPTSQRLLSFTVPLAYSSLSQAEDFWRRAERALTDLETEDVDPKAAFTMLQFHTTFGFGYADRPVRELYERFGTWVLRRVLEPLFPDLTAPIDQARRPGPPRVGIISPDLCNRNGTRWSIGWLESFGPDIETTAIHIATAEDQVTQRFIRAADHYVSLPLDVPRAARAIRDLDLDVLIYPEVGQNGRAVQFASLRLARVQATAWGYPATSGLPNVDYYLAGEDMLPPDYQAEFTEKVWKLPNTGLIMDEPMHPPGPSDLPALPEDYLFMGQNLAKLHPNWDWLWAEISRRSGKPIFMVQHPNPQITVMTHNRLTALGANIAWLPYLSFNQYDRMLSGALASLDTQGWSGGYTTFQAMKVGTPVVTLPGDSLRSRLSLAFMRQAGGQGLAASSAEEFIEMACDTNRLKAARAQIQPDAVFGDHGVADSLRTFITFALK